VRDRHRLIGIGHRANAIETFLIPNGDPLMLA